LKTTKQMGAFQFARYFDKVRGRSLKKFQMQGVEKRGVRRTFLYAAMTSDADDEADGLFE